VLAARIIKILIPEHTQLHTAAVIVLQMFTVSETVDDHYGMPLLVKTENTVVSRPEVCSHPAIYFYILIICPNAAYLVQVQCAT
jgi:hypothetical protein